VDTIVAPATPWGRGAVAIVRLSGPDARSVAAMLCPGGADWRPRRATLRQAQALGLTDDVLVTWMPGPRSFTGEDVVELACHGNPLVVQSIVDAAVALGARPARPGEFTRRAVVAGRLDLVQAEGLAAVIAATSVQGVALARGGMVGELGAVFADLRDRLLDLAAELEARLDQPGGELDVDDDAVVVRSLCDLAQEAAALAETWRHARPRLEGARIALVGPVNAGKSSLFNHLVGQQRALVSAQPGTTRDAVERGVSIAGLDVTFLDTAGERTDPTPLERDGLVLGRDLAEQADLRLLVWPQDRPLDDTGRALLAQVAAPRLVVSTFGDQPAHPDAPPADLVVENIDGGGIPALRDALAERLGGAPSLAAVSVVVSQRQQARLLEVAAHAQAAAAALSGFAGPAVAAEEVTRAVAALAELTGDDARELVLDRLFARFCIGK
jgi:tRNA modification GTPase